MAKNRGKVPRTLALHETIVGDIALGIRHTATVARLRISSKYITQVRQYYLQTGTIPPVPFTPLPPKGFKPPSTYRPDEAKLHLEETLAAQAAAEERARRRRTAVNPTEGGAFPVSFDRLMAGSARVAS